MRNTIERRQERNASRTPWRPWTFVYCLLLALLPWPAAAQVLLEPGTRSVDLAPAAEVLVDPGGTRTIATVREAATAGEFRPTADGATLNFGYSSAAHWIRFTLRAAPGAPERWLLEIAHPSLDRVEVFVGTRDTPLVAGDRQRFSERPVPHRNLVFPVEVPDGQDTTVLLRVVSEGSLTVPLRLWEPTAFEAGNPLAYVLLASYYGALAALLLYNLMLYVSVRERCYLEYVFFVAGMAVGQLSLNGFGNQFLWPDAPLLGHFALPVGFAACGLFGALFTRSLLDTATHAPRLDRLLIGAALLFAAAIAVVLVNYRLGGTMVSLVGPLFALLAVVAGIVCLRRGVAGARFYLLAWAAVLVGTAVLGARNLGWVPTNLFTTYAMQVGSALEMLLLSFALADRINVLRQERSQAQAEALEANERLVRSLQEHEQRLEQSVAQRTHELEAVNRQLQENERRAMTMALHDPLTGLANRLLLDERIAHGIVRAKRHNSRMAVLLIDLNDFKPVNDTFGHAVGDELLKAVGGRLRGIVRAGDTVARLGGDEFVIVLEEAFDHDDVTRVVNGLCTELARPFRIGGNELRISAAVGSALYPGDGDDAPSLLRRADRAMYRRKESRPQEAPQDGAG